MDFELTEDQRALVDLVDQILADHCGNEAHDADLDDVEPPGPREDGARDEHRLAWHRDPEVLHQDEHEDRPQPVVRERGGERVEEAGQHRLPAAEACAAKRCGDGGKHVAVHPPVDLEPPLSAATGCGTA